MIKPILILTDKSDLILNTTNNRLILGVGGILPFTGKCYDIILIDTEAKTVNGDLCLIWNKVGTQFVTKRIVEGFEHICNGGVSTDEEIENRFAKIIASTNKSHNLPLLSTQAIKLLINYYNEHKCMPESVEVREDWYLASATNPKDLTKVFPSLKNTKEIVNFYDGRLKSKLTLNQQDEIDITIPKVEEKLYTEKEIYQMLEQCDSEGGLRWDEVKDWFNSKKK